MRPLRLALLACSALFAASLAGCGAGLAVPVETVTAPAPTVTETATTVESSTPVPDAPAKKRLPDVVGMNLQAGQDTMQAAGFYLLDDQDATGQGRFQVFDRNWTVTRQSPAAGRRVGVDTKVTLYAKKIGE
jgi:hypothetical protein